MITGHCPSCDKSVSVHVEKTVPDEPRYSYSDPRWQPPEKKYYPVAFGFCSECGAWMGAI